MTSLPEWLAPAISTAPANNSTTSTTATRSDPTKANSFLPLSWVPSDVHGPLPDDPRACQYEMTCRSLFERVLDNLADGITVAETLRDDIREISYGSLLRWIHENPDRKQLYEAARKIGTEVMANEIVNIADGKNPDGSETLEDVSRSTLRINTRKFIMQSWNRDRYGEKRQIDQNVNVNLIDAMEEASKRLKDARGVTIEGDYDVE